MLIIVSGLPGTGKTTFARALAAHLQVPHLNSDILRDALGKRGQYDSATKARVYREMLNRTAAYLQQGDSVIVDATFHKQAYREPYLELLDDRAGDLRWIELEAAESLIRARVAKKREYSEADFSVYQKIKEAYEPLDIPHLVLPSGELTLEQMLDRAEKYLKEGKI